MRATRPPPRASTRPLPRPTPPRAAAAAADPPATFWVSLEVRDSELDQFNVVNNALYPVYFQHARHKYLLACGLPAASATADGGALALSEQTIKFRAPLRSGDTFRAGVKVQAAAPGAPPSARIVIAQYLVRDDGTRVADSVATVVSLDARYRPRRVPPAVRAALESGVPVAEGVGVGWVVN